MQAAFRPNFSNWISTKRQLTAMVAAVAAATVASPALAGYGEPFNDIAPWSYQPTMANVAHISGDGWGAASGIFSIESDGDVDYFILSCGPDSGWS